MLHNFLGLDLTKYSIETEENILSEPFLGDALYEDILFTLTSENSKLVISFTFANGNLRNMYIFENTGITSSLLKPIPATSNAAIAAQTFFSLYKDYTSKPIFEDLKSSINNVDADKNYTKILENKILEVSVYKDEYVDEVSFKWCYTANGVIAPYNKVVALSFKDGVLTSFNDKWDLYSIGSNNVNLSKVDAVVLALDVAKNYKYTLPLDDDVFDPGVFNAGRSVPWVSLIFDGSFYADNPRSEDIYELYPVWRVGIVFNRIYGELYGVEVDIWADTGEVMRVKEEYSAWAAALLSEDSVLNNVGDGGGVLSGQVSEAEVLFGNGMSVGVLLVVVVSGLCVVGVGGMFVVVLSSRGRLKVLYPFKRFCKDIWVIVWSVTAFGCFPVFNWIC